MLEENRREFHFFIVTRKMHNEIYKVPNSWCNIKTTNKTEIKQKHSNNKCKNEGLK